MARAPSDIDPKREIIGPNKRRKRLRRRDRPEPPEDLKQGKNKVVARMQKRAASPGVMLEPNERSGWTITSPHNDVDLWELQIAETFGTRSRSVCMAFLRDLKRLAANDYDEDAQRWKANETELNAALAMVADIRPRNSAEAALAAQMVAVHWMMMRLSAQALNKGGMVMEKDAALAGKLARTYAIQLEAMRAMQGGKKAVRQNIKVTKTLRQEVHYHTHPAGGLEENDGQPHAKDGGSLRNETAGRSEERPALSGPCEEHGKVVPLASGKK